MCRVRCVMSLHGCDVHGNHVACGRPHARRELRPKLTPSSGFAAASIHNGVEVKLFRSPYLRVSCSRASREHPGALSLEKAPRSTGGSRALRAVVAAPPSWPRGWQREAPFRSPASGDRAGAVGRGLRRSRGRADGVGNAEVVDACRAPREGVQHLRGVGPVADGAEGVGDHRDTSPASRAGSNSAPSCQGSKGASSSKAPARASAR